MTSHKKWLFYVFLCLQWLIVLPMTVYASERFEDTYDSIDEGGAPVIVLPADPDAAIHFGVHMVVLATLSLVLIFLRYQRGTRPGISNILLFLPPLMCLALRFGLGCLTCRP